ISGSPSRPEQLLQLCLRLLAEGFGLPAADVLRSDGNHLTNARQGQLRSRIESRVFSQRCHQATWKKSARLFKSEQPAPLSFTNMFTGLLMGLGFFSYHVRELLVCWLFLGLLFAVLVLSGLGILLVGYAGHYFFR